MAGCRSFKKDEVLKILYFLKNPRDKALFLLGVLSGFRISELLSLTIPDIYQYGQVVDRVRVRAMHMKGNEETREVPLHPDAKKALRELMDTLENKTSGFVFKSQKSDKAITRMQAHRILKEAYSEVRLQGKCATHSMRKTFAQNVYKALDHDIFKTAKALGHKNVGNTASYLSVDQDEIDAAIMGIK